ncbi:DUF3829 domain-containing protein [Chondromyces apiculatus]|uniref:Putative lipoprotein n=1 Tax=Chondromyces apiculatus DSM 436 TaxID=1192034 RepID=A0A017T5T9_9BACT|nr:DUF3829 domain-containing protein [Chondromyces apiculatus]EYF03951.1 putative lipoprotein [Chondromyces apiculatus DSM 436]
MKPVRSLLSIAFVLATIGAAGCKEDPPPAKQEPVPADSASAKGKLNPRSPVAPLAKVDPQTMKEYRIDVCYYGTLTLKEARDAYLASLGKDEPSEKKIPSFGSPPPSGKPGDAKGPDAKGPDAKPGLPKPAKPPAIGSADPKAPPSRDARPADSARKPGEGRPFNFVARAPHERNARACTVAAGLKDPALPELDAALAAFAPYAVELAKNIAAAQNYYQREEYKKDSFEKGKELHKKLVADFGKLDELHGKLGAALTAHREKNPADASKWEEGQKVAMTAFDNARLVLTGLAGEKVDLEAHKAAVKKLEESSEALKTFSQSHSTDPWPKIMTPALEGMLRALKDAEPKITDKGVDPETFLPVITSFTSVIEAKHRALSRSLIAQGQTQPRPMPHGGMGAPPGAPPGAPGAPGAPGEPHHAPHGEAPAPAEEAPAKE